MVIALGQNSYFHTSLTKKTRGEVNMAVVMSEIVLN